MIISTRDSIELAAKITPKKLANMYRVWSSYHLAKSNGEAVLNGLPISLSIEPTTACNLRCPECPSGLRSFTRPTGKISQSLFQEVIDELHETLYYLTFYFQGEPYLHPDFLDMIRYATNKKIYTATSTNAHFLDDDKARETVQSGLNRLIVSIDGSTQETYSAYRKNGDLSEVIEGTKRVLEWRRKLNSRTPAVLWQFLVVRPNEHQIDEVRQMGKLLGVDKVAFKTAQIYDFENGHDLIPTIDRYSRYRRNSDGTYSLKSSKVDNCWKMWQGSVITWDGQVVPCCFDKDASHPMGALSSVSFTEIWNSENYQNFRQALLSSRNNIEMCANCSEGTKVWG